MTTAFTAPQRAMLLASDPDDRTGDEGTGVELTSGALYATAHALERRGLGWVEGPGGPLCGMYFSNADGLTARRDLIAALQAEQKDGA